MLKKEIARKLELLFPGIVISSSQHEPPDCHIQDDGNGYHIRHWFRPEPEPTQAELDAVVVTDDATYGATRAADEALIAKDIEDNLPDWSAVKGAIDAISNLTEAKAFIEKLTKVVYGHIKGTST